jgi:hypothetical protein
MVCYDEIVDIAHHKGTVVSISQLLKQKCHTLSPTRNATKSNVACVIRRTILTRPTLFPASRLKNDSRTIQRNHSARTPQQSKRSCLRPVRGY